MHIPNQFNTPLADIAKTSLSLNKLQSGQQIYVDVVEQVANKTTTILRIGQQLIAVKTDIPLTPGQTLKVVVETSSDGITLKLPAKAESSHIINTALRQLLPKQTAVAEFQAPLVKTLRSLQQP
ncbi:MAG: flagellar hook-length control protein FliK, partial [Cycloclasticus sp.]